MGEYAIRKSDGQEIKIGTCESMYYIRFEDRHKVRAVPNSIDLTNPEHLDGLRFRLPFPDEDKMEPGNYEDYNRGLRMYKMLTCEWCKGSGKSEFETDGNCRRCHGAGTYGHEDYQPTDVQPGRFQMAHRESGLLLSVPCFHGAKLPAPEKADGEVIRAGWNGKGYAFELAFLKAMRVEKTQHFRIIPVIRCRFCGEEWRSEWSDIWDYLPPEWQFNLAMYKEGTVQDMYFGKGYLTMIVHNVTIQ